MLAGSLRPLRANRRPNGFERSRLECRGFHFVVAVEGDDADFNVFLICHFPFLLADVYPLREPNHLVPRPFYINLHMVVNSVRIDFAFGVYRFSGGALTIGRLLVVTWMNCTLRVYKNVVSCVGSHGADSELERAIPIQCPFNLEILHVVY